MSESGLSGSRIGPQMMRDPLSFRYDPPMRIQVIGAGGWGLALARLLALNGHNVRLWRRRGPEPLRTAREDTDYLPGVRLPDAVEVDDAPDNAAEVIVVAAPSHALRETLKRLSLPRHAIRVSVTKGIENDTLQRMSEVIEEIAPGGPVVALSGPSHAEEVARDLPASVVAAGNNAETCRVTQRAFMNAHFRVYTSADIVGVELGGALKNVIAIAAGACDGLRLGDNAKAGLITRGLAEIARLGIACGANPLTFAGLSGMGDLIATCASRHSRNRRVGEGVAQGKTLDELLVSTRMVAEGVRTTVSARELARQKGVDMPIAEAVYQVLFEGKSPQGAIASLMQREAKPETLHAM